MFERDINEVVLSGTLARPFVYNNSVGDQKMYSGILNVERKSGVIDKIPLRIKEEDIAKLPYDAYSEKIKINGMINSLYSAPDATLNVRVKETSYATEDYDENMVKVTGTITKVGKVDGISNGRILRNFEIVSINYYGKEIYIPVSVWQSVAIKITQEDIGRKVMLLGRLQSRVVSVARQNQHTKVIYNLTAYRLYFLS